MYMSWLFLLFFSTPLKILNSLLALTNTALSLNYLLKMPNEKNVENLAKMENGINSILLISFFMVFFFLIDLFCFWFILNQHTSIGQVGDTKVIAAAISENLIKVISQLIPISFFLIVWFLLRAYNRMKIEKIQKK
jgi:hypothetical protein